MDGINLRKFFLGLVCTGSLSLLCSPVAQAADCALLLQDLSQRKGMMQRGELLNQAITECPDDYQINYYYAYHLERLCRYDEALQYYKAVVKLQPDFAKGYFGMGDVYLAQAKTKTAIDSFKKGLGIDPDNVWAKRSYQKALQLDKTGDWKSSAETIEEVKTLEETQEVPVASLEDEPVVTTPAPIAVPSQAKPSAGGDISAAITAQSFVQSMTDEKGQSDNMAQEHMLSMQIQFELSSGELTEEAKEELSSVVCKALQSRELQERRFEIAGHTDDSGTPEANMYFSKIRAMGVKDYLVNQCGIAPDRLTVVYYGQERPAFPNTSRKNRILNRRVEFRLLP